MLVRTSVHERQREMQIVGLVWRRAPAHRFSQVATAVMNRTWSVPPGVCLCEIFSQFVDRDWPPLLEGSEHLRHYVVVVASGSWRYRHSGTRPSAACRRQGGENAAVGPPCCAVKASSAVRSFAGGSIVDRKFAQDWRPPHFAWLVVGQLRTIAGSDLMPVPLAGAL